MTCNEILTFNYFVCAGNQVLEIAMQISLDVSGLTFEKICTSPNHIRQAKESILTISSLKRAFLSLFRIRSRTVFDFRSHNIGHENVIKPC